MPRSGIWQNVRTNDGWHLRLMGANGEVVLVSETYTDKRKVSQALQVIERSVLDPADETKTVNFNLIERDERTKPEGTPAQTVFQAHCRECGSHIGWADYQERAQWVGSHRTKTGHKVTMTVKGG